MRIRWLEEAIHDLDALQSSIAQDNEKAAANVAMKILNAIDTLSTQPDMGRAGRVPSTRELVITGTPYIIPYRVKQNAIEILHVYHSAMQWPELF